MIARTRIHIIFALVCHLVLASCSLTIGLHAQTIPPPAITPMAVPVRPGEPVTIQAQEQEKIGAVYHLRGDVEITFRNYVLRAGQVTYDSDSGDVTASGNVVFDGGPHDEHLTASHGTYNVDADIGRFYDVIGTTGAKMRGVGVVLTSSNPFSFTGAIVDKVGRDKIVVHHGTVTSCTLPQPKWAFRAGRVDVVAGEDAKIYHTTFLLWRVPVFYFPFMDHPVEHLARKTGFLMPSVGNSSIKGDIFGESFYWAMNRSTDATVGAEYFSRRGWAQHGEFRTVFNNNSYLTAHYFGVLDRGIPTVETTTDQFGRTVTLPANQNQGGEEVRVYGTTFLRPNVRAVADLDYLSSYLFRAAFSEAFTAISSEVRSTVFVTDHWRGYSFGAAASRYQSFQSVTPGDVITIVHAPGVEASSPDRQLGNSRFYWGFDSEAAGMSRHEPGFVTKNEVGRIDVYPRFLLPFAWHGWSVVPQLALRNTWYSDRNLAVGPIGEPIGPTVNRRALQGWFELRPPALARIFDRTFLSRQFKHTIEPRITYHFTTGVDNFRDILLFDERDILSDTNEVEYALVNRLYAKNVKNRSCAAPAAASNSEKSPLAATGQPASAPKPAQPVTKAAECDTPAREIISWELAQKYFFDPNFGGALVPGRRNVFTTTEELTGIAFLTEPRHTSPIISRLRMRGPNTDIEWHLDYDTKLGGINSSAAFVNYRLPHDFSIGSGEFYLRSPGEIVTGTAAAPVVLTAPSKFNQFRILTAYGKPAKPGFAVAGTLGFDAVLHTMQYSAVQANYNWDCCGVTFEYRRYNLGIRNENVFRFALSLANVGTFGTLRKPERLY